MPVTGVPYWYFSTPEYRILVLRVHDPDPYEHGGSRRYWYGCADGVCVYRPSFRTMRFVSAFRPTFTSTLALSGSYNNGSTCHRLIKNSCRSVTSLAADTSISSSSSSLPSTNKEIPSVHIHTSFHEIVDRYDSFILDQFGVLHNGVHALDGALELIQYLYTIKKKKLIILSNTSAPSYNALKRLEQLGFNSTFFIDAVTSGEEASRYVYLTYGNIERIVKVLFITWDTRIPNNPRLTALPKAFLDACGQNIQVTDCIEDADLVLLHGSEVWFRGNNIEPLSLGSFIETGEHETVVDPLLEQFLQYKLPMICANPDQIVVTPTNGKAYMPGRIANRYIELGGQCRIFGKPDVEHFEACIRKLQTPKHRVAHVGDSLHHDVAGANAANIASIFVTSGIHASQLSTNKAATTTPSSSSLLSIGDMPDHQSLYNLFRDEGSIYPTHVIPAFRL
jgi:ribonucleotide monophosphatase NagD (HAD superfamily)